MLEFLFWAVAIGALAPAMRWHMVYAAWDIGTFRPTHDLMGVIIPENFEEIHRHQAESRASRIDWIIAFFLVELLGLAVILGTPWGFGARFAICRLIGDMPIGAMACPPALSWF